MRRFFNPDALHDCSAVAQRKLFVAGGNSTLFLGGFMLATLFMPLRQPNEKMESAEWASSGVPGIGSTYKVLAKIPGGKKERHGYTIDYPDSWLVTERAGEWESGDLLFQHAAGVDTISAPGDSGMVVIGGQQIPDRTTLDQWMNTNTEIYLGLFGGTCGEPETGEPTTIGGEAAITRIYSCSDGYFVIYTYALHEGRGYVAFRVSSRENEAADQETYNQFVTRFAFAP